MKATTNGEARLYSAAAKASRHYATATVRLPFEAS